MEFNAIRVRSRVHYGYIHNAGDILRVDQPFTRRDLESLVLGKYADWIDETEATSEAAPTAEKGPANSVGAGSNDAPGRPAGEAALTCDALGCTAKPFATGAALKAHKAQKHAAL